METLWFCLLALLLAAYVILDGFDLGAGILHLWVARKDAERRMVLLSIGPFWDGNEVCLLAAGGTMFFAFPALYATSFSGFYLPLMMVLWLLILRGIAIELRGHFDSPVWKPLWDVAFSSASALLTIFLGTALGNVIRGVPIGANGEFFLPLWTHFGVQGTVGILDWYTLSVGLLAFVALAYHGGLWVAHKTGGAVEARARALTAAIWWGVAVWTAAVTILTLQVQPQVLRSLSHNPLGYAIPALAAAGLVASRWYSFHRKDLHAFLGSCAYLAGMLSSAAFGIYPYVLPSNLDPQLGLTVHNTTSASYGLRSGLMWWIPGMLLAASYFVYLHRHFAGKVNAASEE